MVTRTDTYVYRRGGTLLAYTEVLDWCDDDGWCGNRSSRRCNTLSEDELHRIVAETDPELVRQVLEHFTCPDGCTLVGYRPGRVRGSKADWAAYLASLEEIAVAWDEGNGNIALDRAPRSREEYGAYLEGCITYLRSEESATDERERQHALTILDDLYAARTR